MTNAPSFRFYKIRSAYFFSQKNLFLFLLSAVVFFLPLVHYLFAWMV